MRLRSRTVLSFFALAVSMERYSLHPQLIADEEPVSVDGCYVVISDVAMIPALERGNLTKVDAKAGSTVSRNQVLATIDDQEATLALKQAQLDLEIHEHKLREMRSVEIARSTLSEARELLEQYKREQTLAEHASLDQTFVMLAEKERELAEDQVSRARASLELSKNSIAPQDIYRLQNALEQASIRVERSKSDQQAALLRYQSKKPAVSQQESAVARLQHVLEETEAAIELENLKTATLKNAVQISELRLERRRVRAPFDGVLVERNRQAGEWVEVGEPVFKIVGLKKLAVEGFADASQVARLKQGNNAELLIDTGAEEKSVSGTLVFVNPEIDSVNKQVMVRVEFNNDKLFFLPGMRARMSIRGSDFDKTAKSGAAHGSQLGAPSDVGFE